MRDRPPLRRQQIPQTIGRIVSADPILIGTQVFISTGYDYGCAVFDISGAKPREIWRSKVMRNHFNSCVAINGQIYGFDESTLKCIDWATGAPKWEQGGLGKGSLIAADGKLIILSEKGELVIADATPGGFKEFSRTQVLTPIWSLTRRSLRPRSKPHF